MINLKEPSGNLVGHVRIDGAWIGSIDISNGSAIGVSGGSGGRDLHGAFDR